MNDSTCIWHSRGICIFDISQPGRQVQCYAAGCRDFEPKLAAEDYKTGEDPANSCRDINAGYVGREEKAFVEAHWPKEGERG